MKIIKQTIKQFALLGSAFLLVLVLGLSVYAESGENTIFSPETTETTNNNNEVENFEIVDKNDVAPKEDFDFNNDVELIDTDKSGEDLGKWYARIHVGQFVGGPLDGQEAYQVVEYTETTAKQLRAAITNPYSFEYAGWYVDVLELSDGTPVYCLDAKLGVPVGEDLQQTTSYDFGGAKNYVLSILANGEPMNASGLLEGNTYERREATAVAVWWAFAKHRGYAQDMSVSGADRIYAVASSESDARDRNIKKLIDNSGTIPFIVPTISKTSLDSLPIGNIETINGVPYQVSDWTNTGGGGNLSFPNIPSTWKYQTKKGGEQLFNVNNNIVTISAKDNGIRFLNPDLADNSKTTSKTTTDLKPIAPYVYGSNRGNQSVGLAGKTDPFPVPAINVQWHARLVTIELVKQVIEDDGIKDTDNNESTENNQIEQPKLDGLVEIQLWKKIAEVPVARFATNDGVAPSETRVVLEDGTVIEYVATARTDANNKIIFSDLPAFNTDGSETNYYFSETDAPEYLNKLVGYHALPGLGNFAGGTYTDTIDNVIKREPSLHTTATTPDGGKVVPKDSDVTLVDTVCYTDLIPGKEYELRGVLMDKSTGAPLTNGTQEVTGTTIFTTTESTGCTTVTFTFNTTGLAGHELVVFEYLYRNTVEVTTHTDINDEGQTVRVEAPGLPITGENVIEIVVLGVALLLSSTVLIIVIATKFSKSDKKKLEPIDGSEE